MAGYRKYLKTLILGTVVGSISKGEFGIFAVASFKLFFTASGTGSEETLNKNQHSPLLIAYSSFLKLSSRCLTCRRFKCVHIWVWWAMVSNWTTCWSSSWSISTDLSIKNKFAGERLIALSDNSSPDSFKWLSCLLKTLFWNDTISYLAIEWIFLSTFWAAFSTLTWVRIWTLLKVTYIGNSHFQFECRSGCVQIWLFQQCIEQLRINEMKDLVKDCCNQRF
jgi:hypothetical protein